MKSCTLDRFRAKDTDDSASFAPWKRWLGLGLVGLSFAFYGLLFLVPQASFSTEMKLTISSVLVISGEASFWIGSIVLGKEVISRYRRYLDPRRWFGR